MNNRLQKYTFHEILLRLNILIVVSLAITHHFIYTIPPNPQWIFFGILICAVGIPHGSLDYFVSKRSYKINNLSFSAIKFYAYYILPMIIYGICWLILPTVSLVFFIIISAFHFGETDLRLEKQSYFSSTVILQTLYGLAILFIILLINKKEVLPILEQLNVFNKSLLQFLKKPNAHIYTIGCILLFMSVSIIYEKTNNNISINTVKNIIISITLVLISAIILPLAFVFGIYFGLWHSIVSLKNIKIHLSNVGEKKTNWKNLIILCLPFTSLAFIFILSIIFIFNWQQHIDLLLMGIFIGISMLTLPHQEVMSKMYKDIKNGGNKE